MSVDDFGIETLKKAAEEITPGDNTQYQYRVRVTESALPDGAATEATLSAFRSANHTDIGAINETAPTTDTDPSGLNGRLQRIAQRLTTLINFFFSTTATLTQVAASATSVTILASDSSRKGFILVNTSNKDAYVAFAATATTTAYTVSMVGGGTVFSSDLPVYTGIITAIWTGTGGDMKVTAW